MPSTSLEQLINRQQLWPARQRRQLARHSHTTATGFAELDRALHLGGWPRSGSTELLCDTPGIGELELTMPALCRLQAGGPIAWLNPPCRPFAPGLAQQGLQAQLQWLIQAEPQQQLWAAEQALRSGVFSALLCWFNPPQFSDKQLRRLHLAAREGNCWHLHFRHKASLKQASPAPLRLRLKGSPKGIELDIVKQYGGHAGQRLTLARPSSITNRQRSPAQWPDNTSVAQRLALSQPLYLPAQTRPSKPSLRNQV